MQQHIVNLTEFRSSARQMLEDLKDGSHLILTQNGSASAVVQDYETYQQQQEAFLMLKLMAQGEGDIKHGRLTPQAEVFNDLRLELTQMNNEA